MRHLLAFVTLDDDTAVLSAEALGASWSRLWPERAPLEVSEGERALGVRSGALEGGVTLIATALPWAELEGPATCAWHWPEAEAVLSRHAAHLVVVLRAPADVSSARLLTQLTAAVVAATPSATGVLWSASTAVAPAGRFVDAARRMVAGALPVLEWIELRVFPDPDAPGRWCLFTTGLKPLGLMEVEVRGSSTAPRELIQQVFDIAHYQLVEGAVLAEGHLLGPEDAERVLVLHAPSAWERAGTVLSLQL